MSTRARTSAVSVAATALALLLACGKGSSGHGATITTGDGPGDPGPGGVRFTASGEALARSGYAFPPASDDDVAFVDGWHVTFQRLIVTIANVSLAENPDKVAGDQSQTDGVVARIAGPWAIDLAGSAPNELPGKGGPGDRAIPFESIRANDTLDADGTRYAFGFDVVAAAPNATRVNLDEAAKSDYERMIEDGCAVYYVGHASFKGDKSDTNCYPPDREGFPDEVDFRFCFKSPTSYLNCQNPDNRGAAFADEESQRGVALVSNTSTIAQVTIHTDHPFWDSVLHDAPLHFDPYAARARVGDGGAATVTLEDTKGVDYTDYRDVNGAPLAWRYCIEPPTDAHAKLTGAMRFDPQSVPHASGADPASGLRDYYDFATYDQSTQGHLNSDGLCFVRRGYPSPP